MRRWIAAVALAGAAALLVSGCTSLPKGVDAKIADDWAEPPAPQGWKPDADKCQPAAFSETVYLANYEPIACTEAHRTETIFVGDFDGVTDYPSSSSATVKSAYKQCDAKATAFLGGHWQDGKLWIGVAVPSQPAWLGGSRWWRCDVVQLDEMWGDAVSRNSTLRNALKTDASVRYGCQSYKSGTGFTEVKCTAKHNAEFVGTYFGVTSYAKLKNRNAMIAGCRGVIARYVGVKNDSNLQYRTGVIWDYPDEAGWNAGDHGVRCWLWLSKKTVTRSLKGAGAAGLPIQYA